MVEPWPLPLLSGGVGDVGKKHEQEKDNGGKERSVVQSFVSFSLEKETEEPPPILPFLISLT